MPFYKDMVLQNPVNTITLVIPDDRIGGRSGIPKLLNGTRYSTPLIDPFSLQTNISWSSSGDLLTSMMEGIAEGANKFLELKQNILDAASKASNKVLKTDFKASVKGKFVTASSFYKKFDGSETTVEIPSVRFYFEAERDTRIHIDNAKNLLLRVLPLITQSGGTSDIGFMKYELPPNRFATLNDGFDTSSIEGTLSLEIGNDRINFLLPATVRATKSKEVTLINQYPHKITIDISFTLAFKYTAPDFIAAVTGQSI